MIAQLMLKQRKASRLLGSKPRNIILRGDHARAKRSFWDAPHPARHQCAGIASCDIPGSLQPRQDFGLVRCHRQGSEAVLSGACRVVR